MIEYAARRLAGLLGVWFLAIVITFVAVQFVPGDPIMALLSDRSGDADLEARLRADYGLDRPLPVQFLDYLAHIADGTFGLSFRFANTTVFDVISGGLLISPILAITAILIAVPLGVVLGVFAAQRANSWADTAVILGLVSGISIPNFAMAAFLVYLLSIKWSVLPVAGWGTPQHLVMPVLILVIPPTAYVARLTRTYMLEVLQQDFVRTARAKGLRERLVIYRHALKNTFVPLLTTVGIIFGGLLSGTFVVETIFNIPGLGRLAIESIFARDYPVTMTIVLLFTMFYSIINLIVDLAYTALDPRIRLTNTKA
ncbi:ABC transporter permease [Nitratireductor pacificus]|uniref:Dipeptide ABC transporter permease n=1 Tax=Nitratireductor pacificus pht-3B TaxID=391937 RepID=K2MNJ6_9HYPH|nr:ABC transporter permease [Nitratireductor pacificus]EKF18857.1 dipeptide ABC transporter permease [Nitratireductor pacificus pht-3B]